mgnify:CR=1 FL=1|jgi:hypothetical protein
MNDSASISPRSSSLPNVFTDSKENIENKDLDVVVEEEKKEEAKSIIQILAEEINRADFADSFNE